MAFNEDLVIFLFILCLIYLFVNLFKFDDDKKILYTKIHIK